MAHRTYVVGERLSSEVLNQVRNKGNAKTQSCETSERQGFLNLGFPVVRDAVSVSHRNSRPLGLMLALAVAMAAQTKVASAITASATVGNTTSYTLPATLDWTNSASIPWSPSAPGLNGTPDIANLALETKSTSGAFSVNLDNSLTLNQINVSMHGTAEYRLGTDTTRQLVDWVANGSTTASLNFTQSSGNPLRNYFNANSQLDTSLIANYAYQGGKDGGFEGMVTGTGSLTLNYATDINNVAGTNGTSTSVFYVGTTGDAASSYTGGTLLEVNAGTVTTSNFSFVAEKAGAFGTGALALHNAALNLNGFSQTVGGLNDGASSSRIYNAGSSNLTLALSFNNNNGPFAYSGAINDGAKAVALTMSGTGTQILSGTNAYSGGTTIYGGSLLAENTTGSATGSGIVNVTGGILGGNGIIALGNGMAVTVAANATLSPGLPASTGNTLTITGGNGVSLQSSAIFAVKTGAGVNDALNVTNGSLTLASDNSDTLSVTATNTGTFSIATIANTGGTGSLSGYFGSVQLNGVLEGSPVITSPAAFETLYTYPDLTLLYTEGSFSGPDSIQLNIINVAVPEPGCCAILGAGGIGLLLRRKRNSVRFATLGKMTRI